jgi:hypothetical protein
VRQSLTQTPEGLKYSLTPTNHSGQRTAEVGLSFDSQVEVLGAVLGIKSNNGARSWQLAKNASEKARKREPMPVMWSFISANSPVNPNPLDSG